MILRTETVSEELLNVIKTAFDSGLASGFRLCGGTALSLQTGTRISIDADFVIDGSFDKDKLLEQAKRTLPSVTDFRTGEHGVFFRCGKIKIDFLTWQIPFIRPEVIVDGIRMLHIEEIVAMKLYAITRRGEKKDYVDIATLLSTYTLAEMVGFFQERHPNHDVSFVRKCLASYADIERQPMPQMLSPLTWQEVKTILQIALKKDLR
ncbi:MAG: nucleotidyl transferase AbiEii/AbiGii toxin family protein [Chitinophagales bacterium]|nr:nucleotidyl transferase AbiEii/AbiGii toxin family protein [Chitinophagales bacterium]